MCLGNISAVIFAEMLPDFNGIVSYFNEIYVGNIKNTDKVIFN